ncbi:PD-(D/E)XK nuclease family protein, partial [Clostridium sp.]|uniref:PD-(D/E)XK nuclease family protein n=1 Tax=Clostridium sp. TaxID=1506 RepID=UPI002607ADFC
MSYDENFYKEYLEKVEGFREIPWVKNYIELKKKPNFWTIIEYGESVNNDEKKSSYEIRMSRMIRWLLDANENHNLGNLFAYKFFKLIDQKSTYKYDTEKNDHIKAINEALKDIDIFYKDLDKKVCLAIEFKQYSSEIIYEDKTSQLDKYQKAVEDFVNKNKEEITPYYVFLTPKKVLPSSEDWFAVGYADVIKILDEINNEYLSQSEEVYKNDIQKIILDFKEDLQRTIGFIDKGINAITIKENYSEEKKKFTNLLANEITHKLDSSHLDELVKLT